MPDPDPASPAVIKERKYHYMGIATLGALRVQKMNASSAG